MPNNQWPPEDGARYESDVFTKNINEEGPDFTAQYGGSQHYSTRPPDSKIDQASITVMKLIRFGLVLMLAGFIVMIVLGVYLGILIGFIGIVTEAFQ